jgi:hypothetical protein
LHEGFVCTIFGPEDVAGAYLELASELAPASALTR